MIRSRVLQQINKLKFDFHKHVIQNPNPKTYTLDYFGYENDERFACTDPFPVLSKEAVNNIQKIIDDEDFLKKTKYSVDFAPFVVRAPGLFNDFMWKLYNCDHFAKYFSDIVGEELVCRVVVFFIKKVLFGMPKTVTLEIF